MAEFIQPTIWNLSNTAVGLQVSYSVAGPHLHYHLGPVIRDFTGSEIREVEVPDLGTLVSVTILVGPYGGAGWGDGPIAPNDRKGAPRGAALPHHRAYESRTRRFD
jgi:hypothetical protein